MKQNNKGIDGSGGEKQGGRPREKGERVKKREKNEQKKSCGNGDTIVWDSVKR